jgi:hypothetical protein
VISHNVQDGRVTRFVQSRTIVGGYQSGYNVPGAIDKFMTEQSLQRLGT